MSEPIVETLLTEAVINDDRETIRKHKRNRSLILAKNSFGFDCIELAKHLNRRQCLKLLDSQPEKLLKFKEKGSSTITTLNETEFENIFGVRYRPYLVFFNYQFFQRVIRSCPSLFRREGNFKGKSVPDLLREYEDKPELFTLRAMIYGDKIRSGFCAPSRIEWVNDTVGYGIFADGLIKMGDFVGTYCGEVRRLAFWLMKNDYSIVYPNLAWIHTYMVDAKAQGNELRFLNHSYHPNLSTLCAVDRGLLHSIFIASKDILKGEQLTWNYGEDFWTSRDPPQEL